MNVKSVLYPIVDKCSFILRNSHPIGRFIILNLAKVIIQYINKLCTIKNKKEQKNQKIVMDILDLIIVEIIVKVLVERDVNQIVCALPFIHSL